MRIKNFKWEDEVFYNNEVFYNDYDSHYDSHYRRLRLYDSYDEGRDDISEVIYDLGDDEFDDRFYDDGKTY